MTTLRNSTFTDSSLTEKINHRTNGRPFLIHHTDIAIGYASALYLHCHSELELFYLSEGELYFYIEDTRYYLKKGDVIYIPGGLMHYATRVNDDAYECAFEAFVFMPELIMDTLPAYCEKYFDASLCNSFAGVVHLKNNEKWHQEIITHVQNLFQYHSTPIEQCELAIRGELLNTWQLLFNNIYSTIIKNNSAHTNNPLLTQCINYITNNFTDNFILSDLADMSGLSEGHFCRLFRDVTGFTPFNYINRVRITKACEMLTRSDKKIADIASLCGFNNIGYFNRIFKNIMKESPSVYRSNFRNMQ